MIGINGLNGPIIGNKCVTWEKKRVKGMTWENSLAFNCIWL